MTWLNDHAQLISALTNIGMLLVWVVYLQVFVSSYRRQLRATVLINRGPGEGLDARCFLCNMSSGPVYVQSVMLTLEMAERSIMQAATDMMGQPDQTVFKPLERTRQGPLGAGAIRDIGSFGELLKHAATDAGINTSEVQRLTIEIVGNYAAEDLPMGAKRSFVISRHKEKIRVRGAELQTEQVRGRGKRRQLIEHMARDR